MYQTRHQSACPKTDTSKSVYPYYVSILLAAVKGLLVWAACHHTCRQRPGLDGFGQRVSLSTAAVLVRTYVSSPCPLTVCRGRGRRVHGLAKGNMLWPIGCQNRVRVGQKRVQTNPSSDGTVYPADFSQESVRCGLDQSEEPSAVYVSVQFGYTPFWPLPPEVPLLPEASYFLVLSYRQYFPSAGFSS